jgi:large subunit ribosomal protein L22
MITARLNDYRQSPRKVRLVADLIKGKKVTDARNALLLLVKRASSPMLKLLDSAIANAKNNNGLDVENLVVKELRVDGGAVLHRRMPRARGMAFAIKKRTSHVLLGLEVKDPTKKELKAAKNVELKPKTKKVAKSNKK